MNTYVSTELDRWAASQLLFWEGQKLTHEQLKPQIEAFNNAGQDAFVFVIQHGHVSLLPKTTHSLPAVSSRDRDEHALRANLYLQFFEATIREHCPEIDCLLAMSMHDRPSNATYPVFSFQKPRGSHAILVPDIDAISQNFYIDDRDSVFYDDKINRAIFVGSTTGALHTKASVRALSSERIRLAAGYRDDPDVVFNLPNIVQCESNEAETEIRALGFGTGALSWQEQLKFRFLLSVDGNGATCSRVAKALKSNSVLLKFHSENVLYYFNGLTPFKHYIPIDDPGDVNYLVAAERRSPGRCEAIAKEGAEFFERFLNRASATRYVAKLLQRYAAIFWLDRKAT